MTYGVSREAIPVTIASGQAFSTEFPVGGRHIVGIQMPAGWDAAGITFQALVRTTAAPEVITWGSVQDEAGVESVIVTPIADEYVAITSTKLVGLGRARLRSGTSGTPVNQTATRTVIVIVV